MLLDRYQILKELGHGNCGRTFLAWDFGQPSNEFCVIKEFEPGKSIDPNSYHLVLDRFRREAGYLHRLSIRNSQVPKLFDFIEKDNRTIIIQEWVPGQTVADRVQMVRPFSHQEVIDFGISVLEVLVDVHACGLIHRDIKPENIILRDRDQLPVLIDFGVAKELIATITDPYAPSDAQSITAGTPGFMPHEQFLGSPAFASDLFSLGLTFVFMLTAKKPLQLDTYSSGATRWRADSGGRRLAKIINKAIRFNHRERYGTATEMLNALRAMVHLDKASISGNQQRPSADWKRSELREFYLENDHRGGDHESEAREALLLDPMNPEAHFILAELTYGAELKMFKRFGSYGDGSDLKIAEDHAREAVRLDPRELAYQRLLTSILYESANQTDYDLANQEYLKLNSQFQKVYSCAGRIAVRVEQAIRQEIELQIRQQHGLESHRAVSLMTDPPTEGERAAAGGIRHLRGLIPDWEAAESCFRYAAELDPENGDLKFLLGQALFRLKCYDEAASLLAEAKVLAPQVSYSFY